MAKTDYTQWVNTDHWNRISDAPDDIVELIKNSTDEEAREIIDDLIEAVKDSALKDADDRNAWEDI